MKASIFFVKGNQVYKVLTGRWGRYCKVNYTNRSESNMLADGYTIEALTRDQVKELEAAYNVQRQQEQEAIDEQKKAERAAQVAQCLTAAPLAIGAGSPLWSHVTDLTGVFGDVYRGCGKGTAYIRENKLIAWHYGYLQPDNSPEDCIVQRCELSCYQLLF